MLKNERYKNEKRGFTLMEIITVVLIVGILVILATPQFFKTRLKGLVKVATAMLLTIRAAERAYYQVEGCYYPNGAAPPVSDYPTINTFLRTDFVAGKWDLCITSVDNFTATATLQPGYWSGAALQLQINGFQENVSCVAGDCSAAGLSP